MNQGLIISKLKRVLKHPLFFIAVAIILLANSGSHPTSGSGGYTGAPGDNICSSCHGGNNANFNGDITISGLPATIMAGNLYQLTVTVTNPNGNASRAGFQILALNASNSNAGGMSSPSASASIKTVGIKKYFGHSPAVPFIGSNDITWTVDWTAPASGTGDITVYGVAILGNNSGSGGDKMVTTSEVGTLSGGTQALTANLSNVTNVSCYDGNDGSATADPVGGVSPYTYSWNNGENTQTANSLPAGLARVTVTDNSGTTTTAQTTITQPIDIVINTVSQTNPTCWNSGNGAITVSASGGNGGFSFEWSNGASTANITGLDAGTYIVTVTDSKDCIKTKSITLTSSPAIQINTANVTNQSCQGINNGSITISASGGTGTLQYDWNNGATTPSISNLAPGSYDVSITDVNNCLLTENYQVNAAVVINFPAPSSINVSCNGGNNGSATANPTGGAGSFTYNWSTGASTKTISNLMAGTYQVTITDANQCTKTNQVVISEPTAISSTSSVTNASCPGVANGGVTITPAGGTQPYTILWSTGATGTTLSNVASGNYAYTVTDSKACTASSNVTIGAAQSALLSLANNVSPSCFGGNNGSITISSQNAAGYTINWSNGAMGTTLSNIPAGVYTALASNPNGCQSNALEIELTQPAQINHLSQIVTNISCFGLSDGAITTNFTGGTGTLTYLWSNGNTTSSVSNLPSGIYNLSVTDANNCQVNRSYSIAQPLALKIDSTKVINAACFNSTGNISIYISGGSGTLSTQWSNGNTGNILSNALAGTYTSTTTDSNGCLISDTFTITSPSQIIDNANIVNETIAGAANGSINTNVSGGIAPYTYHWSNGSTADSIGNLAAGVYALTVTDDNSCTRILEYNVQIGGCALAVQYDVKNVSCFGGADGKVTIEVSNGTPPYTITPMLSQLQAGSYTFNIQDAIGCGFTLSNVVVTEPTALNIKLDSIKAANSSNSATGAINITVSGGAGSYIYKWVDAAGVTVSSVEDPDNLLPGNYTVQIIDSNGCPISSSVFTVTFTSSIDDVFVSLQLYPNPADQMINVKTENIGAKMSLIDATGKLIISWTQRQAIEQVAIGQLNSGLYLIKIEDKNKTKIKTFNKL